MEILNLIFNACPRLRFLDVGTNSDARRPVPVVCRLLCSNVWDLTGNLSDLTVVSSRYYILLCSEILASEMHHVSELLVPGCGRPVLCLDMQDASGRKDGGIRTKWIWSISPTQV